MKFGKFVRASWLVVAMVLVSSVAGAQAFPSSGSFSLYADFSNRTPKYGDGGDSDFSQIIALFSWYSEPDEDKVFEWGLETRIATFPSSVPCAYWPRTAQSAI